MDSRSELRHLHTISKLKIEIEELYEALSECNETLASVQTDSEGVDQMYRITIERLEAEVRHVLALNAVLNEENHGLRESRDRITSSWIGQTNRGNILRNRLVDEQEVSDDFRAEMFAREYPGMQDMGDIVRGYL